MWTAPLPFAAAKTATAATDTPGVHAVTLAGERVQLLAERALFWPQASTLFVADVHLGKAAAFRAGGIPVPQGSTHADLTRLTALFARTGAQRLVVLGDFLHAAAGRVASLDAAFRAWRLQHVTQTLILIRGNHDDHAGDPPAEWGIDVVAEPHPLAPFLACHLPLEPHTGYALCGHIHPGVWLSGAGEAPVRLPCFVIGPRRAILPAFGRFTGLAMIRPEPGETRVAIAGARLFPLPPG